MIRIALKNPYLVVVVVLMVTVIGLLSAMRIPADLLPTFKTSAVQIITFYPGMPPEVMEQDIMSRLQRWTGQAAGIEHQEAKAMQGVCIVKDFFHEGVSQADAISQVSMLAMSDMFYLPPGTIPPMVMPFDPTASVPLCLVTVSNPDMTEGELYDVAYKNLRNNLQSISGVIAPAVYGGKLRRILAYVDPNKMRPYNLSMNDVHEALRKQNVLIPAGSARIKNPANPEQEFEFYIYTNAIPDKVALLNDAPILKKADGTQIRFSDIGEVKDAAQIQTNKVRVNGRTLVYVPVYRQPGANTIAIVDRIRSLLGEILVRLKEERKEDPKMKNLKLNLVMDQSVKVRESVRGLLWAGLLGAVFAGLVVFLFLRDLRSTVVIVTAIPVSVLASLIGLYFTGNSINAMTLGGLALAVGILIDQSIVVIDNVERHMRMGKGPLTSAWDGAREVALPLLVSTVTFIVVFFPIIFLSGLAKYLFTPLALAVLFAIVASYFVAMFFVPVAAAKLLRPQKLDAGTPVDARTESQQAFGWLAEGYRRLLLKTLDVKWIVIIIAILLFIAALLMMAATGRELFPPVDSGQLTIYVRMQSGTSLNRSEAVIKKIENLIVKELGDPAPDNPEPYQATFDEFASDAQKEQAKRRGKDAIKLTADQAAKAKAKSKLQILISNIGVLMDWPAAYTPNIGPMDAFILLQFKPDAGLDVFEVVRELRKKLNKKFGENTPYKVEFAFDTGGILTAALNQGEPSPIHLQLSGRSLETTDEIIGHLMDKIKGSKGQDPVPGATDVRVAQRYDYPKITVKIDRQKAKEHGVTPHDVMTNLVSATNSSINFDPAFWIDPLNGNHYFLGTQYYEKNIDSLDALLDVQITSEGKEPIYLRDVADIITNERGPAVINHRNIRRVTDVYANVEQEFDLGSVVSEIESRLNLPELVAAANTTIPYEDIQKLVDEKNLADHVKELAFSAKGIKDNPFKKLEYIDNPLKLFQNKALKEVPRKQLKVLASLLDHEQLKDSPLSSSFQPHLQKYLANPLILEVMKDTRSAAAKYPDWFQKLLRIVGLNEPTKYSVVGAEYSGFTLEMQGEIRSMRDSFIDFALGLILATVLVYLVIVAQFRSFVDPLIVMATVPLSFIGVALILILTGTRLNIQSFMGIIMMIGIVVEYTIVLMDFANHRLKEGASVKEAIVDACIVRFRPILMTSLTTILALTPMAFGAFGGEADVPLARTIVGGVIAATLLPSFVVPCLYVMIKRPPKGRDLEPGWE